MAYTVFARKYRPQTFEALVGQEHVARTLGNAISQDRVAHAFLFTGVRGVGKTTTARLLAKALNCEKGSTPTPCNECDACRDIAAGVDMDVQEIDGASNNSVEDVRRLQESLPFRPARDRFKIVIVDEVHMLSGGAFNAFLKTLEEPPPHVKFIFATTESHKVPVTIRSRCQRYDFRLIPQAAIAGALREVLAAEGVSADDDAVAVVAREAAGSMRDALTLLDQLVAFGGAEDRALRGEEVAEQLGIAARGTLHTLLEAVMDSDAHQVLQQVRGAQERGTDPTHFVRQLVELLRDLVVLRVVSASTDLVDMVDEERERARRLVTSHDPLELQRTFSAVAKLVDEVAKASSPWLVLEMGLVRIATRPPMKSVSELLARLDALEADDSAPPPSASRGKPHDARSSGPPTRPDPRRSEPVPARSGQRSAPASTAPARSSAAVQPLERGPATAPTSEANLPTRTKEASPAAESPSARGHGSAAEKPTAGHSIGADTVELAARGHGSAAEKPTGPANDAPTDAPRIRRSALMEWEALVESLREGKPALAAVLEHGVPRVVTAERIVLSFQEGSFYGRQANAPAAREAIIEAAQARLGSRPSLEVKFDAQGDTARERTVAAVGATRRKGQREQKRREALNHPAVRDAVQVFPEASGRVQVRLDGE